MVVARPACGPVRPGRLIFGSVPVAPGGDAASAVRYMQVVTDPADRHVAGALRVRNSTPSPPILIENVFAPSAFMSKLASGRCVVVSFSRRVGTAVAVPRVRGVLRGRG